MRLKLSQPPTAVQTGTLTSGSAVVTGLTDTTKLVGALGVSGTGVPSSTYVLSIDSPTQVTLTANATASGAQALTFALEPVSLPDAKLHLRIDFPTDDSLIASLITAARLTVEAHLRQVLLTQTWIMYQDAFPSAGGYYNPAIRQVWSTLGGSGGVGFFPGMVPNSTGVIDIPLPPLQSLTAVQYYDFAGTLQSVPSANYSVSTGTPARIQPGYSKVWPVSRPTIDSVQVTFVSGYGDTADKVPANITAAIKLLVGHWYEHREQVGEGQHMTVPNTVDLLLSASDHGSYF
ncbi:MAG: hypothetical protein NVSMB9_28590 [Isosphaeraceae bacterium]